MLKGYQPWLLLLFGAGTGGLLVAIVLTDLFGISLPKEFFPSQIDSGWGSLLGGALLVLLLSGFSGRRGALIRGIDLQKQSNAIW